MITDYRIRYKLRYVPEYYDGLSEQQLKDRKTITDFKKGIYDDEICEWFSETIMNIMKGEDLEYIVCFIPSSKGDEKTIKRYSKLYEYLNIVLFCKVYLNDIGYVGYKPTKHSTGNHIENYNLAISADHFYGKRVILIDDVLTTGRTFNEIAKMLEDFGAANVTGVFLGRTIHPDLPISEEYAQKKQKILEERKLLRENQNKYNNIKKLYKSNNNEI